ncbi:hypothetical protein B0O80DRAFT_436867 [Mortierella sp. GBAus27b]|nr:hypothetical protein B0O80DRAFT_436867 [Mortierella sp. GBAus27b]
MMSSCFQFRHWTLAPGILPITLGCTWLHALASSYKQCTCDFGRVTRSLQDP